MYDVTKLQPRKLTCHWKFNNHVKMLYFLWKAWSFFLIFQPFPSEPRKKPSYFSLYRLVNRDPYNGLLYSPYNWVVCHPLYNPTNWPFFHCSCWFTGGYLRYHQSKDLRASVLSFKPVMTHLRWLMMTLPQGEASPLFFLNGATR